MPTIGDIRKYMEKWGQLTYKQGLDYCYLIKKDKQVYELTLEVMKMQLLDQKMMDGNSVQNIPYKDEGKVDIIFTDIFWRLAQDYITPAYYVGAIVNECIKSKIVDKERVAGIVGRGLRAFPSFLREMDLTYKLSRFFPNAQIMNGPSQDVDQHTDVLVVSGDMEYRVWSYQNFVRGLENTASRIRGNRGEVPKGTHVLCPIDISNEYEKEEVDGWFFYSDRYVTYLHEMIVFEKPDSYNFVSRMSDYALKAYLSKANLFVK